MQFLIYSLGVLVNVLFLILLTKRMIREYGVDSFQPFYYTLLGAATFSSWGFLILTAIYFVLTFSGMAVFELSSLISFKSNLK